MTYTYAARGFRISEDGKRYHCYGPETSGPVSALDAGEAAGMEVKTVVRKEVSLWEDFAEPKDLR